MQDTAHPVGWVRDRRPEVGPRGPVASRDGRAVFVRAVSSGDEERLQRMFSRLSPRSIYQRFHMPYPRVPGWALALFMDVVGYQGESLVAVAGDEIVGNALYVRSDYGRDAEMAVVVEDGWQSRGVGRLLVSQLAENAGSRGIETFTAEVLGENERALSLLTSVFVGTRYTLRGGVYHVRMPLRKEPGPATNPIIAVRRAA